MIRIYLLFATLLMTPFQDLTKNEDERFIRLVKIEIDPSSLEEYVAILREQMETAAQIEEGVLEYTVVNEKDNPHLFTLIEIYKDYNAYQDHIKTSHFLKYKTSTQKMVQSLELIDVNMVKAVNKNSF